MANQQIGNELTKLAQFKKDGVLNEEEFQTAKSLVLKKERASSFKSNVAFGLFVIFGLAIAISALAIPYFYITRQDAGQTITVRSGLTAEDRGRATGELLSIAGSASVGEITRLIREGADANAITERGYTALIFAVMRNSNPEVITMLIRNGADVNARNHTGATALMFAAHRNSNPEVIDVLTGNGADVNARDRGGRTALDWAGTGNNPEVIAALVNAGAR